MTIKALIAWRLAARTLMGRKTPEFPSKVCFKQIQLRVLTYCAARCKLTPLGDLGLDLLTMAIPGGFLYWKNAPPPG